MNKPTTKIIGEYVERNDINGLAEYFRAYITDEMLESNYQLAYCYTCNQMTNHLKEVCQKWKPQEPMEWKESFKKTMLYTQGGSCWECCEYEDMVEEMEHFISSQIKQAEERGEKKIIDRINYELDIAESDKESADNPEDPRVRINYFRALLKDLINQNNE